MKTARKLICIILAVCMIAGIFAVSASADNTSDPGYATVFLHGLLGWGERDEINGLLPYWGMTSGSLMPYLNSMGYECYAASVGPLSSAWDRACELYAQLVGTTVDYGIAHAAEKDHDRFGITYEQPLAGPWDAEHKINIVGHSFGGATARLFLQILTEGCPEEIQAAEAAGVEPSPFFLGGKGDWVYSITAISAPHNGTTFIESNNGITWLVADLATEISKLLGTSCLKGVYDFQLDQFGIRKDPDEDLLDAYWRVINSDFLKHNDNAFLDLTIDESLLINDGIDIQENVYYFSIAGDRTVETPTGERIPSPDMYVLLYPFSCNMCRYYDKYTAGGVYIDRDWTPNDGMVNTISALYPVKSDMQCLKKDGSIGYKYYDGKSEKNFEKGVWNVMPVVHEDHLGIVGGLVTPFDNSSDTRAFFLDIMDNIYSTYGTDDASGLPFTDVSPDRWSYDAIKQLYDKGVIYGRSAEIFDPEGNITRAEFITILANLVGIDEGQYTSCRFADVPEGHFAAPCIEWAAQNGIIYGYDDMTFGPEDPIKRQDIAAIVVRLCKYAGIELDTSGEYLPYVDEGDISAYALEDVITLKKAGIMVGNPDGTFAPKKPASREEVCVLCVNCGIWE